MKPGALALLLLLFGGCETVVDVDLPGEEPQLVVHGFASPDRTWSVDVKRSARVLGMDEVEVVPDALVEIERPDGSIETLAFKDGRYVSSKRPAGGSAYTLRVSAPGFAGVVAADSVPNAVPFSAVTRIEGPGGPPRRLFALTFADPPDRRDYYRAAVTVRNVLHDGTLKTGLVSFTTGDASVLAEHRLSLETLDTFQGYEAFFTDMRFAGSTHTLEVTIKEPPMTPDIARRSYVLALRRVSEAYYLYARSLEAYDEAYENPFMEPARLWSNVQGGYGIFAGYAEARVELGVSP